MAEKASKGLLPRIGDKLLDWLSDRAFEWVASLGLGALAVAWVKKEWACIAQPVCPVAGWEYGVLIAATLMAAATAIVFGRGWHRARRELQAIKAKPETPPKAPPPDAERIRTGVDSDLTEEQVTILHVLAVAKDRGKEDMEPSEVARPSRLTPTALSYHAEELRRRKLIRVAYYGDGEHWSITPAGAGWLHLRHAIPSSDTED